MSVCHIVTYIPFVITTIPLDIPSLALTAPIDKGSLQIIIIMEIQFAKSLRLPVLQLSYVFGLQIFHIFLLLCQHQILPLRCLTQRQVFLSRSDDPAGDSGVILVGNFKDVAVDGGGGKDPGQFGRGKHFGGVHADSGLDSFEGGELFLVLVVSTFTCSHNNEILSSEKFNNNQRKFYFCKQFQSLFFFPSSYLAPSELFILKHFSWTPLLPPSSIFIKGRLIFYYLIFKTQTYTSFMKQSHFSSSYPPTSLSYIVNPSSNSNQLPSTSASQVNPNPLHTMIQIHEQFHRLLFVKYADLIKELPFLSPKQSRQVQKYCLSNIDDLCVFFHVELGLSLELDNLLKECKKLLRKEGFEQMNYQRYDLTNCSEPTLKWILREQKNEKKKRISEDEMKEIIHEYCMENTKCNQKYLIAFYHQLNINRSSSPQKEKSERKISTCTYASQSEVDELSRLIKEQEDDESILFQEIQKTKQKYANNEQSEGKVEEAFEKVGQDLGLILKSVEEGRKKLLKLEKGMKLYSKSK